MSSTVKLEDNREELGMLVVNKLNELVHQKTVVLLPKIYTGKIEFQN